MDKLLTSKSLFIKWINKLLNILFCEKSNMDNLLGRVNTIYYMLDSEGKIVYLSPGVVSLSGIRADDLTGKLFSSFIHSDDKSFFEENFRKILQSESKEIEYRIILPDGSLKWAKSSGVPYYKRKRIAGIHGFLFDITRYKNLQNRLASSETKFKAIYEHANDAILLIKDNIVVECNSRAESLFGAKREDIIQHSPAELSCNLMSEIFSSNIPVSEEIKNDPEEKPQISTCTLKRKDNSLIDVEINLSAVVIENTGYFLAVLKDITEQKRNEEKINEQERNFRSFFNSSPDPIYVLDKRRLLLVNPAWEKLFEYRSDEVCNDNFDIMKIIAPESRDLIRKKFETAPGNFEDSTISSYNLIGLNKSRKKIYLDATVTLTMWDGKKVCQGIYRDVTSQKKSEESLYNLNQMLHIILDNVPQRIYWKDRNSVYFGCNKAFAYDANIASPEEIIGKSEYDMHWNSNAEKYIDSDQRIIETEQPHLNYEEVHHDFNGNEIWVSKSKVPLRNMKGEVIGVLGSYEDITEKKKREDELRNAKDRAEELNTLKSNFLANMSHELRTPMIGILGYSEMLIHELKDSKLHEMANIIYVSGRRLLETLNLILDLSRIEANRLELNNTNIEIETVIDRVVKVFSGVAASKNIKLKKVINVSGLVSLLDEALFEQVLNNLVNNALKFTIQGSVTVIIDKEIDDDTEYAVVSVVDTGIGISPENQGIIFDEFRQVSEGFARRFEGTGLGLTITRKIVELMNGKIFLKSKPGKGSNFSIRFPVSGTVTAGMYNDGNGRTNIVETKTDHSRNIIKILVVDDDENSRNIVSLMLKKRAVVDSVEDGYSALEKIKTEKYDIILVDISLKGNLDGLSVLIEVKKDELNKNIPVIAFTAFAMSGDREKFIGAGFNDYLSKPFEKQDLLDLINRNTSEVNCQNG